MDLIFDMETHAPDDALTSCLLATQRAVSLRALVWAEVEFAVLTAGA